MMLLFCQRSHLKRVDKAYYLIIGPHQNIVIPIRIIFKKYVITTSFKYELSLVKSFLDGVPGVSEHYHLQTSIP